MTYTLCKRLIDLGRYDKEDLLIKLDVFLLNGRIDEKEYSDLVAKMM